MLIPKKNRKEVYKYLFKGEASACLVSLGCTAINNCMMVICFIAMSSAF